jgi:hypothetical protein
MKIGILLLFFSLFELDAQTLVPYTTDRNTALAEAYKQKKMVLLVAGTDACVACQQLESIVFQTTSPALKQLIENYLIWWYCPIDHGCNDYTNYSADVGSYPLPLVCIINPYTYTNYLYRGFGYNTASYLLSKFSTAISSQPILSVIPYSVDQIQLIWNNPSGTMFQVQSLTDLKRTWKTIVSSAGPVILLQTGETAFYRLAK